MRVQAILNRDGGTFRTTDLAAYARHVQGAFADHGHQVTCHVVGGRDVAAAIDRALADDGLDALLAGGGDGTVSLAAGRAWKAGVPLGVIPAGTMNLFARALGLPLDIWAVPMVLAAGNTLAVDIGSADGHPFVHQFSAGLHARMVRLRNAMTYGSRLGKMAASLRASLGVMLDPPVFEVTHEINGRRETAEVSAISVSNNSFGSSPYLLPDRMDAGHLGVYLTDPLTPLRAARLAIDLMLWRFKANPAVRETTAQAVELHFPKHRRSARCVIDGELMPLPESVSLRIHAGALKVLGPG
ncbi:diacylglycerol/lipid kinase family protein [Oryzibacter oryziterrae]|uniref:diacylglycerol/lipid kinase family protein n=1 Tax=Oryzibacter oryziterrae TaxID=2766474 RepID=UPI001F19742B|nr:diacylglycerol kinase family protein [Oryzibacter oryziterrae]